MIKIKTARKDISIRMIVIILFIAFMITTAGVTGCIVFSNWMSAAEEMVKEMAEDMNLEIFSQVDSFINIPFHINEVHNGLIEKGIIDMNNQTQRERFFVEVLKSHSDDVYSFSYGTEAGEYYGARRNEKQEVEIMRNDASTGGHSWYYSVKDDLTAGERVVEAGRFDPRTRDWYKAAKETKKPVFSPIYQHFVMDDLTLSAACPIFTEEGLLQGVMGTHITLSRIDNFLREVAEDNHTLALIIEKDSGELIANSLNIKNYSTSEDGTVKRAVIDETGSQAIIKAYNSYKSSGERYFRIKSGKDRLHISLVEYQKPGVEWLVISAVQESRFTAGIIRNMELSILLTVLALILTTIVYLSLTNRFLKPINSLIATTEKLSSGDLSQRAEIVRNDEIGRISKSFNEMADTIFMFVNRLEEKVRERTEELRLILDSTAEAIYGVDVNGKCTFCNASALRILGYKNEDELIGKNMHMQIHHSYIDGTPMPVGECKIYKTFITGKGMHSDDEVFWRADGTSFDVEYYSYPQYKNGEIVGAVVTFMDNTERKRNEEHIRYLSYHDSLTGLYNRMFFKNELKRIDTEENLPISIIFGDVNGLKLTNDIFGHAAGDALLKKSAEVLKSVCRENDIIARVGGDEFAILLRNTKAADAVKIIDRAVKKLSKEKIAAVRCSISMGFDTKDSPEQSIERTMENAENEMYREKTLNRKTINSDMIETIIQTLHSKNPGERLHSQTVGDICQKIGQALEMPEKEIRKLRDAGFLHDIGKVILEEGILNKEDDLTEKEKKEMQQHPIVGYRILNLFDETLDLAEGVLYHHENWDGSGYPKGLKGEEIPWMARIIAAAERYDAMTNSLYKKSVSKEEAMKEIKKQSGVKLDPQIADILLKMQ